MTGATQLAARRLAAGLASLLMIASPSHAQDVACFTCHADVPAASPAHPDLECVDCHANVTPGHEARGVEPLTDEDGCGACHRRPHREIGRSVHAGEARCIDCHGDPHRIHPVADRASAVSPVNQIEHCGSCHTEPANLVDGYLTSVHGKALLESGLAGAPSCSDCHGDHGIHAVADERALTSHANAPEMCGACHSLLLDDWKTGSAHGMAWQEGRDDGPVCTDCHVSHELVDTSSPESRLTSADTCGECHAEYLTTFRDSFHGKASALGLVEVATCTDCHTAHANLPAEHPQSSVHPDKLMATCGACHEGISPAFVSFEPHNDPSDPNDNYYVYLIWLLMTALLIAVFGFFGLHDLLWLQRTLVGALKGEFRRHEGGSGVYVRRFSHKHVHLSVFLVVTFLLLALTGLPLKFHDTAWAQMLMTLLGGIDTARIIHRVAAIGTFGYAAFHLVDLFLRWSVKRERGLFWGANSMVPQPRDFADVFANFRYFLYLGDRPAGDRWNYIEKFDYLAVFWGVLMIGLSGLILWMPAFFTGFLPGWTLNAAYVVHSDEALLATGFIFVFHFFHTHLRPETFPMDVVIFTGKMSLETFKTQRPLEYRRLLENDELDDYLVDPPTPAERRRAYLWGSVFLVIGVALAVGIISALLAG